jgi:hypothetical protein
MHQHSTTPPSPQANSASPDARVKSFVRNILLASPDFPIFYADTVIANAPNSNEAKILARNYQKIVERVNQLKALEDTTMPAYPDVKICTHIKVTGVRCGSPTLRGEQFCYFHQRMLRGVRTPPRSRLHPIALIENEEAIQSSLMEVINALLRNTIDLKRAELILRALHIAVKNARRVKLDNCASSMVTEVPDYAAHPAASSPKTEFDFPATAAPSRPAPSVDAPFEASFQERWQAGKEELDRQSAARPATTVPTPIPPAAAVTPAPVAVGAAAPAVGTAAPGCPSGPAVSVRSAVTPNPDASRRKPPVSVRTTSVPKERKIAAQGAQAVGKRGR